MAVGPDASLHLQGYIFTTCTAFMLVLAIIILVETSRRSLSVLTGRMRVLSLAEAEM
jgi:hypothetical protein